MIKKPKVIWAIIAIISISISLAGFLILPSFWFWAGWEVLSLGLVMVGCAGEWCLFKNPAKPGEETHHRGKELQFLGAVAIGVSMEFVALAHVIPEAIRLEQNVADANGKVELLRKANDEFEEQAEPMSVGNQEEFIKAIGSSPSVLVGVTNIPGDARAAMTARNLVLLFRQAGWPVIDRTEKQKTGIWIDVNAPLTNWKNKAVETASFLQKVLTDKHLPAIVMSNSVVPIGARETMVVIDVQERPDPKLYEEIIGVAHICGPF